MPNSGFTSNQAWATVWQNDNLPSDHQYRSAASPFDLDDFDSFCYSEGSL